MCACACTCVCVLVHWAPRKELLSVPFFSFFWPSICVLQYTVKSQLWIFVNADLCVEKEANKHDDDKCMWKMARRNAAWQENTATCVINQQWMKNLVFTGGKWGVLSLVWTKTLKYSTAAWSPQISIWWAFEDTKLHTQSLRLVKLYYFFMLKHIK